MQRIFRRYYRVDRNGHFAPKGLVCWKVENDKISFGWSLCHPDDEFSKRSAREVAEKKMNDNELSFDISNVKNVIVALYDALPRALHKTARHSFTDLCLFTIKNYDINTK